MNVIIDIGNTSCKVAFCPSRGGAEPGRVAPGRSEGSSAGSVSAEFSNPIAGGQTYGAKMAPAQATGAPTAGDFLAGAEVFRFATQKETISYVRRRLDRSKADTIILSNVRRRSFYLEKTLERMCARFVNFDEDFVKGLLQDRELALQDPLQVLRHMPMGMGADRMAAIFGAEVLYPLLDKLVFDFGTATTVEFIDALPFPETTPTGSLAQQTPAGGPAPQLTPYYRGGSISLGLNTRYRALSHYTAKIPYLDPEEFLKNNDICKIDCAGYNLDTALAAGNILGIMFEIQGYAAANPGRKLILTGGNAARFAEGLEGLRAPASPTAASPTAASPTAASPTAASPTAASPTAASPAPAPGTQPPAVPAATVEKDLVLVGLAAILERL